MIDLFGKPIPVTAQDLLTERAALIVWDMQRGIAAQAVGLQQILANINALATAARARANPVVFTQHYSAPLAFESRSALRTQWERNGRDASKVRPGFVPGSEPWRLLDGIQPGESDVVLAKRTPSIFEGTAFRGMMSALDVDVLVLTGVATDRGILTSAREAAVRGFFVVVVADAVGAYSEAAQAQGMDALGGLASICSTPEVLAAWSRPAAD